MDPQIGDYIREHRDTYTREAITEHLRAAGHSQEAIDAAWWQTVEVKEAPPTLQPGTDADFAPRRFWAALVIYVVGLLVATNVLNWLSPIYGAVFYFTAVVVGILFPIFTYRSDRSTAIGVLCGLAIVIGLFFVAPGLCTVGNDISF